MTTIRSLLLAILLVFCNSVFAENDTSYYRLSAGYSGLGLNPFNFFWLNEMDKIRMGAGLGLVEDGILAVSGDLQLGFPLPENPKLAIAGGLISKISIEGTELIPYIGLNYGNWESALGYSICWPDCNSLSLSVGYFFEHITEKQVKEVSKDSVEKNVAEKEPEAKSSSSSSRWFRPGIEINYPVHRSEIEFFENEFPYLAYGIGLFFRIGPEFFYFTTGAYAKVETLYKEGFVSKDLGILGISIASLPLLDLEWNRLFLEVPLLLNFGSGQIRFTGGALLDFYAFSEVNINVNEKVPIGGGQNLISANDAEKIEKRFGETPAGNLYWVFGIDIDIVRHWGLGVKCLIWNNTVFESSSYPDDFFNSQDFASSMGIEPSRFQTRVSTYFVF